MNVEQRAPGSLTPYERNPRRIPDEAVAAVAESIERYGFRQPIVVDTEGVVVAGHTRLEAAKRLGLEAVPVVGVGDLSPEEVRAYRLADNRTAEISSWEIEGLAGELAALEESGLGPPPGFDPMEVEALMTALDDDESGAPPSGEEEDDEVPADPRFVRLTFWVPRAAVAEIRRRCTELVEGYGGRADA